MALEGIIQNKWQGYTYRISWTGVQDTQNNSTRITCKHYLVCDNGWGLRVSARTVSNTVNSNTQTFIASAISTSGGTTTDLGTTSYTINHDTNGAGNFSLNSSFPMQARISGIYINTIDVAGSGVLDPIPRESTVDIPTIIIGEENTISINQISNEYSCSISYTLGSLSGEIVDQTTEKNIIWTPDVNTFAAEIPNSNSGNGVITVQTYYHGDLINTTNHTFSYELPSIFLPTIDGLDLSPEAVNEQNILIAERNKLTLSAVNAQPSVGSTIQSYIFSGENLSMTTTNKAITIGPLTEAKEYAYQVTVVDTRGRTTTTTNTIVCHKHTPLSFSLFDAFLDNGNLLCNYRIKKPDTIDSVSFKVSIYYKKNNGKYIVAVDDLTEISGANIEIAQSVDDTTYSVYAVVEDEYGIVIQSDIDTVFGSMRVASITPDGTGIAIGKKAETNNLFESRWDIKTNGLLLTDKPAETLQQLTVRTADSISDDTVENWAKRGNFSTYYFDSNITSLIDQPTARGILINLVANQNNVHHIWLSQSDNSVYHRRGTQDGFGVWLPFTMGTI